MGVKRALPFGGLWIVDSAAADAGSATARTLSAGDMAAWALALLLVLAIFLLVAWGVSRISGMTRLAGKMRIVGGLSLGMREKVVLLQVGSKQLLLGVTPGRIDTLYVLEDQDDLPNDDAQRPATNGSFARQLMLALKNRPHG